MSKGRNLRCARCRRDSSVTAGTIFADTRLPLTTWFAAAWYVTGTKHGVSALGLQRLLGLGSYETAWSLLHKLRRAMVRPGREQLGGEVEVDETTIGASQPGRVGRGAFAHKAIVAIAVEARPRGACGRVRLARVRDCSGASLGGFVSDAVEAGSVVYTDRWQGYGGLRRAGFLHQATSLTASGDPGHVAMPRVHRVSSLLKRWLLGTHQGATRPHQLDFYLDEFTFRFNRRSSHRRGLLFYRLLEQAMQLDHVRLAAIVGGRP
jgi:transposase-like protein